MMTALSKQLFSSSEIRDMICWLISSVNTFICFRNAPVFGAFFSDISLDRNRKRNIE